LQASQDNADRPSLGSEARSLLREMGTKAKKGLGQHFLVDGRVLKQVVGASRITPEDTVIEVGPGLGVLTRELVQLAGRVISVEIDETLAGRLETAFSTVHNLRIVHGDILGLAPASLLPEGVTAYKVVANLPYYITSPVIRHFLEADPHPELMVVMVQKEVAASIAAQPGKMSLLSVGVQLYGKPEIVGRVSAGSFHPAPKVDSAIVRITAYPQPVVEPGERQIFFSIVRAGFGSPRKQLINTLSHGLDMQKEPVLRALEASGIEASRRAETLSIEEWHRLYRTFQDTGGLRCTP
jgi:16S rRNA (adenine1518-N6/adenine1519-N6)-dimethyltransferase